jgi:hypothetical protein
MYYIADLRPVTINTNTKINKYAKTIVIVKIIMTTMMMMMPVIKSLPYSLNYRLYN